MLNRRAFLAGGALALARPAAAQPARRLARIGVLTVGYPTSEMVGPEPKSPVVGALLRGLRELGYVYGEHFATEARGGESRPDRFPGLVADLIRSRVDVIVAPGPMLTALRQATSAIPVVMAGALDPVGQGLIKSLRQPGGNFTGFSLQSADAVAKRLELLKELVPGAQPVAVLWERTVFSHWTVAEATARERGWKLLPVEVRAAGEIEAAMKAVTDARASGLLVLLAAAPGRGGRAHVLRGRHRGHLVPGRGVRGQDPEGREPGRPAGGAALEVRVVINLKAAQAIGLTIPPSLLVRADEVLR